MIRLKLVIIFLIWTLLNNEINCDDGFFTVVGSHLIKFQKSYRASVAYSGYESKKVLEIGIALKNDNNASDYGVYKNVTLSGSGVQNVDFDLKDQPEGDYIIEVKSDNFSSYKKLHMNNKKFSIFTQTDKSVYKPSDLIKFRILVLDAETKPFEDIKNIEVFVTDGADNRIKQFDNVKFTKGVYQNEVQLSDSPVLGKWKIHTKINAEESQKSFDVDEYVLPKFEVSIDANPDANFKDGKIRATVRAKYTFGKIAKGNATVTAEVDHPYRWWRPRNEEDTKKVSKTVEVDGKKFVEFDIKEELGMSEESYFRNVKLFTTFTDKLSGKEANATAKVEVHKTRHKIDLDRLDGEKIKPGLPYKVVASVRYHDHNAPVNDKYNPLKFTTFYYYDVPRKCTRRIYKYRPYYYHHTRRPIDLPEDADNNETTTEPLETTTTEPTTTEAPKLEEYDCREEKSYEKETEVFLQNGNADINLEIPSNTTHIRVKAKYLETEQELYYIGRAESTSNQFIQAKVVTKKPSLQNDIEIEVLSTSEINQLFVQIFGKGVLAESKSLSFESAKRNVFTFTPTVAMLPKANVVINYITSDGEIISDKIEIEFGNELINHIDLKLSKEQTKPGEDLDISISTRPNSFVGLLGVDQSVLLLKKGNDIEKSTVFDELNEYGQIDKYNHIWYEGYDYYNRHEDFENSEAVIITNAKKETEREWIPYYHEYDDSVDRVHYQSAVAYDMQPESLGFSGDRTTTTSFAGMPGPPPPLGAAAPQASAFNRGGGMTPSSKPIEIRKEFPETWLFDSFDFDSSENKTLRKKVPDTITSWIITGFSVDPSTGLGLTKESTKLNVFQPFFVTTNLPYSIKRGEVVAIPIIVFNYLENDQNAQVTLFNKDHEFEFVDVAEDNEDSKSRPKRALESEKSKTVEIKSNEGATISFMIRPLKVGQITIKVTAESDVAGDGLEKQLRVEPEGVTQYMNEAIFIDLRKDDKFSKKIEINVPENAVSDSTKVEASAIGDILGPTIENIHKLIKLPYGCGEQNMVNFVPNIVVLDYLTNVNKLTSEIEQKAKKYMEVGYQKELTYKHDDGSYSAFGKSDKSGSTWLTAFVAKSFNQASKYIHIDDDKVTEALDFLAGVQTENGSFPEVGQVFSRSMQGGSSKGIALTAYTLITFLENKNQTEKYKNVTDKAINFIVNNSDEINDTYSLAIAAYALQLAQHESKDSFISKLDGKSENKDGMKYWKKEEVKNDDESKYWYYKPNSVNVEMSAYALQAFIEASRDSEAVPILKWLITQRNENGGFQSTQDTVVGLQALSKLGAKIYVPNNDIKIAVKSDDKQVAMISLNQGNALILQKHEMPSDARHFEIEATGKGFSVLQISYKYNLDDSGKFPRFVLKPVVEEASNKEFLHLTVCTNFVADAQVDKSNMAIMEVTLPSGFTFDSDHLSELLATARVKKVETKDDETIVMVYFDDIGATEICPDFKAYRTHGVAKLKPVPIVIYDYYDNSRRARTFYNPPEISLCDICENEIDCQDTCEVPVVEID